MFPDYAELHLRRGGCLALMRKLLGIIKGFLGRLKVGPLVDIVLASHLQVLF